MRNLPRPPSACSRSALPSSLAQVRMAVRKSEYGCPSNESRKEPNDAKAIRKGSTRALACPRRRPRRRVRLQRFDSFSDEAAGKATNGGGDTLSAPSEGGERAG